MFNINFCKHSRNKFVSETKRVAKLVRAEAAKKRRDELERQKARETAVQV